MKLFSATLMSLSIESAVELKGWSHCGQPVKVPVCWYPFEEWTRKIYFYAKNRSDAARQCERLGLSIRDLNNGTKYKNLLPVA